MDIPDVFREDVLRFATCADLDNPEAVYSRRGKKNHLNHFERNDVRAVARVLQEAVRPKNEGLVEPSRRGDIDASKEMLIRSAIAQSLRGG